MNTFAVLGDTHFVLECSHEKALHGQPGGPTEYTDLTRNGLFTREVMPRVLAAVKDQRPDWVLHTGDIIPGHCDTPEGQLAEMEVALKTLGQLGVPVYFSFGSHDGKLGSGNDNALRELVLPGLGRLLGVPPEKSYYAFTRGGCRFISLDYNTWSEEQRDFLEQELSECPEGLFRVVFGHPPVCAIARPFFTREDYCRDVGALFARYPVHAYFCGHTHNQAASLHRFENRWVPQLMSTPLAYPRGEVIPLTDVRPFLLAVDSCRYGWGYLEDSLPGWWQVTVEDDALMARWHVLERGVQGVLRIPREGETEFLQLPAFPGTRGPLPDLNRVESAKLRIAGSGGVAAVQDLRVNGVAVETDLVPVYFDSRQFIPLPKELLRKENTISLRMEAGSVGALVLELTGKDGSVCRSSVSCYYTHNEEYTHALPHLFYPMTDEPVIFKLNFL